MDIIEFHPKVSIIIPVFNGSNYLKEAIDSALAQTYDNFEVIIINDGSNDDGKTESISLAYGERVRYYSKPNGGVASALNFGIEKMTGEYFSWLSHDDIYYSSKIQHQINCLSKISDKRTVLYSDFTTMLEPKKEKHDIRIQNMHNDKKINVLLLLFASRINGCTLLIHKSIFDELGSFNLSLKTTQDYEYWFKILHAGFKFEHVKECLMISRHHVEQDTLKVKDLHIKELNDLYEWAFNLMREKYFKNMNVADLDIFLNTQKERNLFKPFKIIKSFKNNMLKEYSDKPIIWLYWENINDEHTPFYIELCYETIYNKCKKDFNIIKLDPEDIDNYLPNINKKYLKLSEVAHRADYIRYNLLYNYGGIWLDSDTIVLNNLSQLLSYIEQYGVVFPGYKYSNEEQIPLIAFLGAKKNNIVIKKVIDEIEKNIFTKIDKGKQPQWDEMGGKLLQWCASGESYYMFELKLFSPAEIHTTDLRRLFYNIKPNECIKKAYTQFLPNSKIGNFMRLMEEDILLTDTLIAKIFRLAINHKTYVSVYIKRKIMRKIKQYPNVYNLLRILYYKLKMLHI